MSNRDRMAAYTFEDAKADGELGRGMKYNIEVYAKGTE